jgi:hypothetical protein
MRYQFRRHSSGGITKSSDDLNHWRAFSFGEIRKQLDIFVFSYFLDASRYYQF